MFHHLFCLLVSCPGVVVAAAFDLQRATHLALCLPSPMNHPKMIQVVCLELSVASTYQYFKFSMIQQVAVAL